MARIFVADDDGPFQELMQELLQDEGYGVTLLKSADSAYQEIVEASPDLVTLDMRLAHQHSGWTLLQQLKVNPQTAHIPVVVCTADISLLQKRGAYMESMGCYLLEKPFDLEMLLATIREAHAGSAVSTASTASTGTD
ncbi:MAG: response regulator [Chloroflexota bacterium]